MTGPYLIGLLVGVVAGMWAERRRPMAGEMYVLIGFAAAGYWLARWLAG